LFRPAQFIHLINHPVPGGQKRLVGILVKEAAAQRRKSPDENAVRFGNPAFLCQNLK
jgi:hypothetical protein